MDRARACSTTAFRIASPARADGQGSTWTSSRAPRFSRACADGSVHQEQ
jgi:hypothetical protein